MPQAAIDEVRAAIRCSQPIDEFLFSSFSRMYPRYMVIDKMPEAVRLFIETKTVTSLRTVFRDIIEGYIEDVDQYTESATKAIIEPCLRSIPVILTAENKRFTYSDVDLGETDMAKGNRRTKFRYFVSALNWLSMAHIILTCNGVSNPKSPLEGVCPSGHLQAVHVLCGSPDISLRHEHVRRDVFRRPVCQRQNHAENAVAQAFSAGGRKLVHHISAVLGQR